MKNLKLKQAIVDYVFDNTNTFNLTNATTEHFSAYIYDAKGQYLIGGEEVANFVNDAIQLIVD